MSRERNVVSAVLWTTIYNIINAAYSFIAVPILIRYFGKEEYGLIGLAMSVNVYLQLMDMGFNSTNVRFFSNWLAKEDKPVLVRAFQTSLSFYGIIGIINALVLLVISIFSSIIFNVSPDQNEVLKSLLYILAFSAFINWFSSCFDQLIRATENVAWIQKRSIIPKLLMILVLLVTVYLKLSIEIYYLLYTLAALSMMPFSFLKIRRMLPYISFRPTIDREILKRMLPYCINIFSFSLFQFSFYNLRPIFLGVQGTIESVTDYQILNTLVGVVSLVGSTFMGALLPSTSKVVAEKNKDAYYRVAYQGTRYISILVCLCCFGMISIAPELLKLYVGEEFMYLLPWLIIWLICTLGTHNQAISTLILAGDDIRSISYSSAASSIIGLVVTWFCIPNFDVGGTVLGLIVYNSIQILFFYCYYWPVRMKISSIKILFSSFGPFAIIGALLSFLISNQNIDESAIVALVIKGSAFGILYILVTLCVITKEDRKFLLSIVRLKKN